jgi:hypothetical protein
MGFGMWLASAQVPAFTDDDAVAHQNATDTGIGRCRQQTALGERQRTRHEFVIGGAEHQC